MKIKSAVNLQEELYEAIENGTSLYVDHQGDIYTNPNYDGLVFSGVLDKPHMIFETDGVYQRIQQVAKYTKEPMKAILFELYEAVSKKIKAWNMNDSKEYKLFDWV